MCGILHTEGRDIIFTFFKYFPQEILCFPYEYSVPKILTVHLALLLACPPMYRPLGEFADKAPMTIEHHQIQIPYKAQKITPEVLNCA